MDQGIAYKPRFWPRDFSLSALLVLLLVLIFIVYPLGEMGLVGGAVVEVLFSLMLISGVMSLSTRRSAPVLMGSIAFAAMLSGWLGFVSPSTVVSVAKFSLTSMFLALLVVIVLIEVFRDNRITFHRIQGAIAAYLLIGVLWALLYRMLELFTTAFQRGLTAIPTPTSSVLTREYIFFSFGSLTTVGYSGLIAVHPLTISLAMMEALIGQLFPAILLARLVSMEVDSRKT